MPRINHRQHIALLGAFTAARAIIRVDADYRNFQRIRYPLAVPAYTQPVYIDYTYGQ